MKKEVLVFGADEGDEALAHIRAFPLRGPEATREENARRIRAALAEAYATMDAAWFCRNAPQHVEAIRAKMAACPEIFVAAYFGDAHAYAIMQDWLNAYDGLERERAKPNPDLEAVAMHAEDCGRLQERLWWRAGVDEDTRERREALALREKAATGCRRRGGATNAAAAANRRATALRLADEIRAQRSKAMSVRALAEAVRRAWPQEDESPPSLGAVRSYLG